MDTTTAPDTSSSDPTPVPAPLADRTPLPARSLPMWGRVLICFLGLIAANFAPLPIQLLLDVAVRSETARESLRDGALGIALAPLLYSIALVVVVLVVRWVMRRWEGRTLRDAGVVFTRWSVPWGLLGVLVSVAITLVTGWWLEQQGLLRAGQPLATTWGDLARTLPVWLGLAVILQGFPEELIFRGWFMQAMRHRPMAAWLSSSLVFGAIHLISAGGQENLSERLLYIAQAAAFGACAGALLLATRSLWSAVGIHAGLHVGYALYGPLGIGDGPAQWALATLLYLLAAGAALLVWHRTGSTEVVIDR